MGSGLIRHVVDRLPGRVPMRVAFVALALAAGSAVTAIATADPLGGTLVVGTPIASSTTPATGQAVTFTKPAVTLNAGEDPYAMRYTWDFGDGAMLTVAGGTVGHTFGTPGAYAVHVTVADSEGNGGVSPQLTINVHPAAPAGGPTGDPGPPPGTTQPDPGQVPGDGPGSTPPGDPGPLLHVPTASDVVRFTRLHAATDGTITVLATLPGAGRYTLTTRYGPTSKAGAIAYGHMRSNVVKNARVATFHVAPGHAASRALRRHTRLHVRVSLAFTPSGGARRTTTATVSVSHRR